MLIFFSIYWRKKNRGIKSKKESKSENSGASSKRGKHQNTRRE
jgi:hypothetical protein